MAEDQKENHSLGFIYGDASIWKSFVFNVSAVIMLFILAIFLGVQLNNERLINNELHTRAKSDFDNILLTRQWNAQYGGVYVEKLPGMESNRYLINPDITAVDGTVYTKKNPALMTREISSLKSDQVGHSFHITSLRPLNPENAADVFETDALRSFETGTKEVFRIEKEGEKSFYRYMAPLFVKAACMACHAHQGYEIGQVRGGISVKFDITDVQERLASNRYGIWGLSLAVSLVLLAIIFSFVRKVKKLLDEAHERIQKMAVTDELTRLHNRRYFMKRFEDEFIRSKRYSHPLSCIMLDIDFFKRVNDDYGHQAGDHVLQSLARLMEAQGRNTDVLARYGGEEFIILLPETELEGAVQVAERLRATVEAVSITLDDGRVLQVTVSLGACSLSGELLATIDDIHGLIKMADEALYQAKENGRNRVEMAGVA